MFGGRVHVSELKEVSGSAIFGALALALSVSPLRFPFPLLPYLEIDLMEVPVLFSFLVLGPRAGLMTSLVCWLALNFFGSFVPIGPAMKLASMLSTLGGMWLALEFLKFKGKGRRLFASFALGAAFRVGVMTLLNYLILVTIPGFLELAEYSLSSLGLGLSSHSSALIWALLFTGLFNLTYLAISFAPVVSVVEALDRRKVAVWVSSERANSR